MTIPRRQFCVSLLAAGTSAAFASRLAAGNVRAASLTPPAAWIDQVGVTTSSLDAHVARPARDSRMAVEQLPQFVREELGMQFIDFNTNTLGSYDPDHLARVRNQLDKAGCTATNIKLNAQNLNIGDADPAARARCISEYKRWIEGAQIIGAKFVRPFPFAETPEMQVVVDGYLELCEFAEPLGVTLLVENYNWLSASPHIAAQLVEAIGHGVTASPDTGNWPNEADRHAGLAAMFPLATTCDFKFRGLGANGEHTAWQLKPCFEIGRQSGFRGLWCLEHANTDRAALVEELVFIRDRLQEWMKETS